MILAAPLVIPFAEAVGISIATLGMAKAADMVNDYIQENPEQSAMILKTLVPNLGIGEIFMNKEDSGDDEEVSEEEVTESESGSTKDMVLEELNKEKGNYSDPEAKGNYASPRGRIIGRLRREGKIRQGNDPNYDPSKKYQGYKRFIRPKKADGGAIGIEVLFEEKKPRKNFFMGGPALEGQALNIYNSMNAYGFDDQAIANALTEQGLYTAPGSGTPETPPTTIQPVGLQTGNNNFSPYNPDPNKIQSFKTDSRIAAANEADIRNKQLTSMGIKDPFADEISLSGAYYGDMPTDTSNQIGKQSMFAKAKQGLTGLMDNPLVNLISSSTPFGMAKNLFKGIGSKMPVNQRAIQEGIMGNLGFAVNDIGQIVSTGDYDDESGDNVMAGYNLNRMTVDTFKNRIDKIRNRKAAQTAASRARIAAIQEAQRKFELAEKLKADALLEAQLKKAQQEIAAKGYQDYGQGGADQATQDSYQGSDGNYAGASTQDYDTPD